MQKIEVLTIKKLKYTCQHCENQKNQSPPYIKISDFKRAHLNVTKGLLLLNIFQMIL